MIPSARFEQERGASLSAWSRRDWLSFAALAGLSRGFGFARADDPKSKGSKDDDRERAAALEIDQIDAIARKQGLGRFRSARTTHYLTIGDAENSFRLQAGKLCEALARDYLAHFKTRGFAVEAPKTLLTIVALADEKGFRAFSGLDPGTIAGGVYNLDSNRLFVFDYRRADLVANAARTNSVALFHEATHQLTFNTGLLRRDRDVPVFVSEAFATYGEVRRPNGPGKIGDVNRERLAVLSKAIDSRDNWVPLRDLLGSDEIIAGDRVEKADKDARAAAEDQLQTAYAESWLFLYDFMRTDPKRKALRAYLKAIRTRKGPDSRLEDAQKHLGDLDRLDDELRGFAARIARG